jgi:hypothetical protein
MTSWTAEVEWHEDLRGAGHRRLAAIREHDWGSFHLDSATGTVTATGTMEAPDLLVALRAVLLLVRGLAGQPVTLNRITSTDRITATDAYAHDSRSSRRSPSPCSTHGHSRV